MLWREQCTTVAGRQQFEQLCNAVDTFKSYDGVLWTWHVEAQVALPVQFETQLVWPDVKLGCSACHWRKPSLAVPQCRVPMRQHKGPQRTCNITQDQDGEHGKDVINFSSLRFGKRHVGKRSTIRTDTGKIRLCTSIGSLQQSKPCRDFRKPQKIQHPFEGSVLFLFSHEVTLVL